MVTSFSPPVVPGSYEDTYNEGLGAQEVTR